MEGLGGVTTLTGHCSSALIGDLQVKDVLTTADHHESSRYPTSLSFQVTAMQAGVGLVPWRPDCPFAACSEALVALLTFACFFSSVPFVAALFGPSSSLSLPP